MPAAPAMLHEILDAAASRAPAAAAIACGDVAWSFGELAERADALANGIRARCRPDRRVALLSHSRAEYVVAYYGVPWSGRVLVLLNPRLHPAEWAEQLARADAEVVIGEQALLDQLRRQGYPACVRDVVRLDDPADWSALLGHRPVWGQPPGPDSTAWLLFTSGTTGRAKGVPLTHRHLLAAVRNTAAGRPVGADDVFCTPFPLCHVAGYSVLVHHAHGRPVRLLGRFDAAELVRAVVRDGVSSVSLAPTMIDGLLDHLARRSDDLAAVRARLRRIGYGAAPMAPPLLRRTLELLDCELNQGYGMTELAGNAVFLDAAAHRAAVTDRPEWLTAAGRPGPLVEIRTVDPDGGRAVGGSDADGSVGEIVVRGEQVTSGYWDDPGATAAAFTDGWFRTGDLGRLDPDGVLHVVDRLKDVIITGGENVSSREVEDVLRAVPGVADAAVVGVPDAHWGERVCAVVVPAAGEAPEEAAVVAACRERLAGFKTPRRVMFVDDLPRTSTGKVRKDVLRQRLAGGA